MKLYYWIKAQAPRRVLALVKHLGIDAELVEVDAKAGGLKSPDYAALNPNMKAPTLVDGDDGLMRIPAWADPWPSERAVAA
jgi:glutathione S-transferase